MKKVFILFLILFLARPCFAEENILKVEIDGNKIISNATVVGNIKVRANQPYNEDIINEDVKALMGLGYFEKVDVERISVPKGCIIRFVLKEKPVLKGIEIRGAKRIRGKKIKETLDLKEGTFFDELKLNEGIEKVRDIYTNKGFSKVVIKHEVDPAGDTNGVLLRVIIDERGVVRIRKVNIEGNEEVADRAIKKLMKTRPSWLFGTGVLKQEVLDDDMGRIRDFYVKQGFSDATVDYTLEHLKDGVHVTVNIEEGNRYHVGEINVEGNREISEEDIRKAITIKTGEIYTKYAVDRQVMSVQSVYVDRGYIFAQVKPLSYFNPQTQKVDVTFQIVEDEINYVEMIYVRGNHKTRDSVIRRNLRIYPGDRFEGEKIRKSSQRLENLGFFEEIRFDTEAGTKPDWQNLIVEVKEAKTGYLSFGGGYSSVDDFIGFTELRQTNFDYKNWKTFTGAGQDLSLYASAGTLSESYELSFTNPYVFDLPYSFGFDVYKKEHERDEDAGYAYHIDNRGGALRLGKECSDYLKAGLTYRYEQVEIGDVEDDATQALKDEEGTNDLSSLELNMAYDTRDNVFNPMKGIYLSNSFDVTGGFMGGDKDFVKMSSRLSFYFSLINSSVLEFKFRAGLADPFSNTDKIPIYKRFFAGGANSIRGYRERKVGPVDDEANNDPVGGEALFVYNMEYTYPLADFFRVATFFDSGNVWAKKEDFLDGDLKSSAGLGIRVKTPLGPISLDYGWPFDKEPGKDKKEGRFHFSISRGF